MGFFLENGVSMLKKTTLAVLSIALSGVTFAGTMGCQPGNVTVPCEDKKWDIGAQALYLKPTHTGERVYHPATNEGYYPEDKNDWGWGFLIEGSYHYKTGEDITMNWTHYDNNTDQGPISQTQRIFVATGVPATPFVASAPRTTNFNVSSNTIFDQVNLLKGQHVDVGLIKDIRFFGGLQYASMRFEADNIYIASSPILPNQLPQYSNRYAHYEGIGPIAGIDYSYEVANGFSITSSAMTSILYGNGRYNSQYVVNFQNTDIVITNPAFGQIPNNKLSKKYVVPSLEGKIGVNYAKEMASGTLNVMAGYQVLNYFNALFSQGAAPSVGVLGAPVPIPSHYDFALNGLYVGAKWLGNA
jgi:hypothetical protein